MRFIAWSVFTVLAGVGLGLAFAKPAPRTTRMSEVVWSALEVDVRSGRKEEWRFPIKNDSASAIRLPDVHLRGCSACLAATWVLPRETADKTPTLAPGATGALMIRSLGLEREGTQNYLVEFSYERVPIAVIPLRAHYYSPSGSLSDALSARSTLGSTAPLFVDWPEADAGLLPNRMGLSTASGNRALRFWSTPGRHADGSGAVLFVFPPAAWGSYQGGTAHLGESDELAIKWQSIGLPPVSVSLRGAREAGVAVLVLRSRLTQACPIDLSFKPDDPDAKAVRMRVRALGEGTFRLPISELVPSGARGTIRIGIVALGFEKRIPVRG